MSSLVAASDLARAAYCPRQLYYARRDEDRGPPPRVNEIRALAFEYPKHLAANDDELAHYPLAVPPDEYRENLRRLRERDDWDALSSPIDRDVLLTGKDCRGVAHKLGGDPVVPSLISSGEPPERGVWEPQRVRAVALAKALSWERETSVSRALVEYPTVGVVRTVRLTTGNKAAYRRALQIARELDFVPPRLRDSSKCDECAYREQCGVKTRSLRSRLGW
ncbi:Dna2/Cas4 domain-containing protein [Haloferax mediterranei ATCC 33500]|uniref:Dna2/Cas4 domain-containing protein n=1 Tax=Haloferax mediterranei (strain ATCC 33500 / DSM 1411 / JCM 8866 / NBRC 14739 / NCIMB 2177 / R-4) TaxID=523841 RepID=I3R190_HALMT|nr:Dna2/Cas4 domain-containing protein [Haloferax mediterranei]AFK18000.1 hypothetical protein HFX_0259 [Haloferax mediterranei ATCC 33500]AHZ22581.1 hypothetical protein BM92_07955 [Haloferax mediterranei ATCC 33500]EMA02724.1 hypothetical protein C439_09075 [Haloferax mediterranei ATCC 33500]MDX5988092.1 Dna2/Cas4 domain-containing protein [Haloferax mediterranei ATCC 33500]QCQ74545.1 Dna2/Cas4 domain-containing protein [Haloferax mediterranei ATCC 33500]